MPAETPLRFHPEAEDEMNVTADWYSVFHRVDDRGVLVVSIAHQSREPLYWLGR